ncbi:MAG: phosphatidylserine decarboxylase, partial [Lentisphaeria bacterium]|nr:phosphatidylserine decarboxylase [Lentisphaeria bacterium]
MTKGPAKVLMIRDRASGELREESVFGDRALRFFYRTLLGRGFWGLLFNSSCLSRLLGLYYDSRFSRRNIASLASTPGCHGEEAEKAPEAYSSFNDFFTRRLKEGARPFDASQNVLSSPADGRLLVYASLGKDDPIPVKGAKRTLNELCCGLLPGEGPF